MTLKNLNINKDWTLFLDRDGVINRKLENDYVKHWVEFQFIDGSLLALKKLSTIFGKIIVVTNQQGIGKGLYRKEDLELIHNNMNYEIEYCGGKIDKVYFSPYLASQNHPTRKPEIGMALEAKKDFPSINFSKSIIVGDSKSDIEFGKKAGMTTVLITSDFEFNFNADYSFTSLFEFSLSI